MMKSFFKKLAFVMALAMVVTLAAPAAQSAYAATEFTYAYQNAGAVDTLYMEAGDEVDLCFKGVMDYKNYTLEWKSANPLVATVDNKGVVKAVENGTTTIELVVGDGSVYTSTPVKVIVGEEVKVSLGTSKEDTFTTKTLEVGEAVDLGFYGVPNWSEKNYSFTWISNAPEVVKVDQKGVCAAVAAGSATVTVAIVNNVTGETLNVTPVVFTVPTPVVEVEYEIVQTSDKVAEIVFNQNVTFTKDDLSVEMVYDGGFTATWPIKNFTCKDNKVTFEPYVPFQNGDKYLVKIGAEDEGTDFITRIDRPNRIELTYKTLDMGDMGKDKAYTNGEDGPELTVQMSAKLFLDQIDVTAVYSTEDIVYSLAQENENVMVDEYAGTLTFSKAGVPVTVLANYVYYDADDNEMKVPGVVEMTSEKTPAYTVTGVKAWTIATGSEIDWSKPNHTIPAYETGKIVALVTDNYGNIVATADDYTHKNMDNVQEYSGSRFANEGYYVTYFSANVEKLLVGTDGTLTTYTKTSIPAIFELKNINVDTETQLVRNLYAATVAVKDSLKFDHIDVNTTSVTLVTGGDFTIAQNCIVVTAYDNNGNVWDKAPVNVEVTCSVANTTNIPASGSFTKEQKYTLDGAAIDCEKSTFNLTFKVGNSSKTVKVNLKDPKYYAADEDGKVDDIKITSYQLEATGANQTVAKEADGTVIEAKINYYTLSNGYKVGTVSASQAALVTSADDLKLTTETAKKGDQFVVVYYPNGSIVGAASATGSSFGVSGEDGQFKVTVAYDKDGQMQYDKTGTYTVKVLQVSSFNKKGEAVFSTKYSSNFKVDNNNKAVALMKQEKINTTKTNIADIIEETLKFTLGGSEWKDFDSTMVDVDPSKTVWVENEKSSYIVINKVTINVPLNGKDDDVYYTVTVDVNKAVKVPEGFDWK